MRELRRNPLLRNLANITSILGVLPLCILFGEQGWQYLLPLIVYNNVMDDLDGVLAAKLDIKSNLGALLDNVCDAISHTMIMMVVGRHYLEAAEYSFLGAACLAACLLAIAAIILRGVVRIDPAYSTGTGSPTNELIRHVFFVLLLAPIFEFDPTPYLIVACVLHTVSMHVPFKMPLLIRSLTKSATSIGWVLNRRGCWDVMGQNRLN